MGREFFVIAFNGETAPETVRITGPSGAPSDWADAAKGTSTNIAAVSTAHATLRVHAFMGFSPLRVGDIWRHAA